MYFLLAKSILRDILGVTSSLLLSRRLLLNEKIIPAITVAGESNTGLVRRKNEDSFCLFAEKNALNILAVVADGVGGHEHGDLASYLCCRSLLVQWRRAGLGFSAITPGFGGKIRDCIKRTNNEICNHNRTAGNRPGMCTTLVAAVFAPETVFIFNF